MSRIGNKPVTIQDGVTVSIEDGGRFGHKVVKVNGPLGELSEDVRSPIEVKVEENNVVVTRPNDEKANKALHGLYRALIANMVEGVTAGYKKELEIVGIGYRAEQQGEQVVFSLGYAHKINLVPPAGINVEIQDQTKITVSGIDKQLVGKIADLIRSYRKPEPYKGKGVRYKGEQILRKSVKQGQ